MVIFITGKPNSGKTTLAYEMFKEHTIVIDGDEFRHVFPTGFSDQERHDHVMHMAKTASIFEKQGKEVIVAAVMPTKKIRTAARKFCRETKLVYIQGGELWPGTTYEIPDADESPIIYPDYTKKEV